MSREIKFRAWIKERNEFLFTDDGHGFVFEMSPIGGNFISYNSGKTLSGNSIWEQYTGLKDKNGVEIYEGDVLKHDLWGNSAIVWEHGMFRGIGAEHDVTLADHQLNRSRIIGNIHENPELLK